MALHGALDPVRAQVAPLEIFGPAFAYLDELFRDGSPAAARLRGLAAGDSQRIELAGGSFALEQVYPAKVRADAFFESHRKYIDVQVVFEGVEAMELADIARLTTRQPYHAERDVIVYADCPDASVLRVRAGEVAVFFPADGHMPGLRTDAAPTLVRKTVIKVPVPAGATGRP
ncbi:MAG: YhcH/YjgK/YiaL family protein [Verrucomicrobiota bacterium]